MITQSTLAQISRKEGIGWTVVEKDYFLTLLLDAIATTPFLHENLIFKGGTALRKAYFGDYRYSEDLDFTLKKELGSEEIKSSFETALAYLGKEYNASLAIKDFDSKRHFTDVKVQFVGLKGNKNKIAVDLIADEIVVDEPLERKILNVYYEKEFSVKAYSLEEITAEKLRSFMQRTRVRDYYDVWYLLKHADLDRKRVAEIFSKKVECKKLSFSGKGALLDEGRLAQAEAYYDSQIGSQIRHLPQFKKIADELREEIEALEL